MITKNLKIFSSSCSVNENVIITCALYYNVDFGD